jgi:DNA helicase-2/ATP-dependent DNA helicase PcrA
VLKSNNKLIFTPEQEQIINTSHFPLRIVAGAGSGKTFVLIEKVKHLLNEGINKPILILTFTKKACDEIKSRLFNDEQKEYFNKLVDIFTYHSFCNFILRKEINHLG